MNIKEYITVDDLYKMSENDVLQLIKNCEDVYIHAAARLDRRGARVRAASRRLDRGASRPSAEGRTISARHYRAVARRSPSDRSSLGRARHRVDGDAREWRQNTLRRGRLRAYRPSCPRFPQARGASRSPQGGHRVCACARRSRAADLDPRSVEPLGLVHFGRLAVVLLAADPRAALRARLSGRA